MLFPKFLTSDIIRPPITFQGSKMNLLEKIFMEIEWHGKGIYFEPFLGSGCTLFNANPKHAMVSDTNIYTITLFKRLQDRTFDIPKFKKHLIKREKFINQNPEKHYYILRESFNAKKNLYDFIALTLSCYHNLMRFNSEGNYNSPFCQEKDRYIVGEHGRDFIDTYIEMLYDIQHRIKSTWKFYNVDFRKLLPKVRPQDFVYLDPPYTGRDTTYFDKFSLDTNQWLNEWLVEREKTHYWVESNWYSDANGLNPHIAPLVKNNQVKKFDYTYMMGNGKKGTGSKIIECIIISQKAQKKKKYKLQKYL